MALYIEGVALTEAEIFFENVALGTVPQKDSPGSFQGKFGDEFAVIVVRTTRSNPGWLDVDIPKLREELWIE
ncbi:hypothetical protein [Ruegeria sp. Ofav3-42]|uniref:hypothetical protein n=1 Tax=Ruegeria sp. Ofav3-42 TaxID=2917759 RepID=UPI001EF7527B|nr:hypothetical protein [Ruegeria sp. Ofav3-42]MCG7518563.1 hypothetical protein [Ruegeria sp. Ofav3-42]